ncbi:MAG TPA: hypothetical protein PLP03_08115 [Bacteroidales bacterium]|jgi:hypothetical protein|nr:hypothetical protein [Bacteroidales bacterium]
MKNLAVFSGLLALVVLSCTEQPADRHSALIATGISVAKGTEIVCVDIDSGAVMNTTPIDCYLFGSTVYDPTTKGYGFVDCHTTFNLINPESGKLIKSIKLPGNVTHAVIDAKDNLLIGRYATMIYEEDPDTIDTKSAKAGPPIYTHYIIRVNLSTGAIVSNNEIDLGDGAYATTYYYNEKEKHYVLYRADKYLITINPATAEIIKELYIGKTLSNSVYNPVNNTLICLSYSTVDMSQAYSYSADSLSYSTDDYIRTYLTVINHETGAVISNNLIESGGGYQANIAGYDRENNWYIAVNSKFEVVCFDVSTGEVKKRYIPEDPMKDMKFWRRY